MILQILHINSIVSPLMDSKLFFKRFVMRKFLCMQFLALALFHSPFFSVPSSQGENALLMQQNNAGMTNFLVSRFLCFWQKKIGPKKDKNMC